MRCDACVWNAKRRVLNLLTRYDTRQKHIDLLRTACPAAPTTSELRRPHQRHERSSPPRRACISCSALVDVAAGSSPDVENPTSGGDLGRSGSTLGPPSGAQNAIGKWRTVLFLTDKGESRGESRFPQEKIRPLRNKTPSKKRVLHTLAAGATAPSACAERSQDCGQESFADVLLGR